MSERRAARAAAEALAASATLAATGPDDEQPRRRKHLVIALGATLGGIVAIAVVVALVASSFVSGLARSYDEKTQVISDPFPTADRPAPSENEAMNILLIGSDSRSADPSEDDGFTGGRSDTLMLAHIPADRQGVYLMSIMRDSWVDVPGHGSAKINAAYSWGGVPLTVQTVENLLDVRIDHVAEIDFAGFKGMTDALGGVTVQSPKAFTGQGGTQFSAGPNRLDGDDALKFVRERHAFADADHTRVRNQQAFMRGLLSAVLSKGTLTNPGRLQAFVSATSRYLSVDPGLDFSTIVGLGWSLRDVRPADLTTFTMPTAGGSVSPDGQSYVAVNRLALQDLSSSLRSDDLDAWVAAQPRWRRSCG